MRFGNFYRVFSDFDLLSPKAKENLLKIRRVLRDQIAKDVRRTEVKIIHVFKQPSVELDMDDFKFYMLVNLEPATTDKEDLEDIKNVFKKGKTKVNGFVVEKKVSTIQKIWIVYYAVVVDASDIGKWFGLDVDEVEDNKNKIVKALNKALKNLSK